MSALFGVTVDELVKGGVEAISVVEAQERRRARLSYATAAGIGLVGAAVVAPALVAGLGALGGALSLAPVATALAVAGVSRSRASEGASLHVLREALESNVELRLHAEGDLRDLAVVVLNEKNERPYLVRHAASVPRGERWRIEDVAGRRVARVAYRVIMTAALLPSIEAQIDGVGTVTARKNLRMRAGVAQVWELEGCDVWARRSSSRRPAGPLHPSSSRARTRACASPTAATSFSPSPWRSFCCSSASRSADTHERGRECRLS